jgi:hypothetical protein
VHALTGVAISQIFQSMTVKNFIVKPFAHPTGIFIIVLLLGMFELGLMTFLKTSMNDAVSPFLYFGVQLLIGVLALLQHRSKYETPPTHQAKLTLSTGLFFFTGSVVAGAVLMSEVIENYPAVASLSDVIPQAQILSARLLRFDHPYQAIDFGTYIMNPPTYLPAHWMPYMISSFFQFDPRWVCFLIWVIAWLLFFRGLLSMGVGLWQGIILLVLPAIVISAVKDHDVLTWAISLEMMVAGYYLALGAGLASGHRSQQSGSAVLCLMSRFALLFWMPIYLWVTAQLEGKKAFWRTALVLAGGCAILYVPFLGNDPFMFFKTQQYYNNGSVVEWIQGDKPPHLYNHLGFARFYFEEYRPDLTGGVLAIKKTMLLLSGFVMLLLVGIFQKIKRWVSPELFLLGSFKIMLAVFYSFIQIPYHYLYVVPMITTLPVLSKLATKTK